MIASKWLWIGCGLLSFGCGLFKAPADKPTAEGQCYGISDRKTFKVGWQAIKSNGDKVKGEITGKGVVEPGPDGTLTDALLELEFDVFSIDSGIPLRNERLLNYFFKAGTFGVIEFKGKVNAVDVPAMPADGESRKVTIEGPLSLAGQIVDITVFGEVKNQKGTMFVKEDPDKPSFIDVKATSTLAFNVDQLLHTADVSGMQRNVSLYGTMPLAQNCN